VRYCRVCGAAFRSARTCPKDRIETDADTFDPLVGRVLGDRYRILGRIAAGGMGQVYRAAHTRIACVFAVKVVWGDFAYDASMQSRFIREAEIASCLQSRHIVRVIDFSHDEGSLPYLVMELLDGPSLYDVIVREGALAPDRAVRIAISIARGLGHAHERGVVHRDLKPENVILVTEEEERDVVKILDFGVARLRDGSERLTSFGTALGTPIYMSPEQFRAQDVDARSDLYSLGIVLYEMLTGKPPFDSPTLPELTRLHMETAPPSLRASLEPKGAGALDDVVARLLAKNPDARYASARDVVAALREWLEIESAPATIAQPSLPFSRASQTREATVDPTTVAALRRAITEGAPRYNAGDIRGCYELYRGVADGIARSSPDAVAVVARLNAACTRAAMRRDPTEAAWDIRYAFDDLLAAQAVVCSGDLATDEVARMASIAAKREVEGRFDMLGDYQTMFAQGLAARLRQDASAFTLVSALDRASQEATRAGGGQAALRIIEPVLAKLRVRSSASTVSSSPDAPAPSLPSAAPSVPPSVSDDVRQRVARAIRIGAPAYNQGLHDVCARVYREAANEILQTIPKGSEEATVALLKKGLHDASGRVPTDAAWIMRHAFDTLLAGG
jgi:hypothetical protein